MELTWYGLSCFRIMERKYITVVTDPYKGNLGLPTLKLKGDVVTISQHHNGRNDWQQQLSAVTHAPILIQPHPHQQQQPANAQAQPCRPQ